MKTYTRPEAINTYGHAVTNIARALQADVENTTAQEVHEIYEPYIQEAERWVAEASPENGEPSVYIGTYHKYNNGSLFGMWVNLAAFSDYDDFMNFARALHSNEPDPEIMLQDAQYFPDAYYSESPDREGIEKAIAFAALDDHDRELLEAYIEATSNNNATIEDAQEAFVGEYDSHEDFAESLYEEMGYEVPEWIGCHIDWKGLARDLMMDYYEENGYYFHA